MFIRFDVIHECDRHTDRHTNTAWRHRSRLCIASRGNKVTVITSFNDLEWPLIHISRSWYYSTSNNSQMLQDKWRLVVVRWISRRTIRSFTFLRLRQSYSYNGGLIESHTWSIEPHLSRWPWRTPNPDFKVRPFFDAEYRRNGCRHSHSYYGRRIGNRTEAFKRYHFQWPWLTSNPHFKVTIYLTSNNSTNSKSYMICPVVPFPVTLSDP